jgi:hypothetical protein
MLKNSQNNERHLTQIILILNALYIEQINQVQPYGFASVGWTSVQHVGLKPDQLL